MSQKTWISVRLKKPMDLCPTGPHGTYRSPQEALEFIEQHRTIGYELGSISEIVDMTEVELRERAGVEKERKRWWKW